MYTLTIVKVYIYIEFSLYPNCYCCSVRLMSIPEYTREVGVAMYNVRRTCIILYDSYIISYI